MARNYCKVCGSVLLGGTLGIEQYCFHGCRDSEVPPDEFISIPGRLMEILSISAAGNGVTAREVLIGIILQWSKD